MRRRRADGRGSEKAFDLAVDEGLAQADNRLSADKASPRPTVVAVLPSPAGVGLIAVTRMSLPSERPASPERNSASILAIGRP